MKIERNILRKGDDGIGYRMQIRIKKEVAEYYIKIKLANPRSDDIKALELAQKTLLRQN